MTIDTATVARAVSRTLGGEWKYHKNWVGSGGWFETNDEARVRHDPREDTDVCLEMLHTREMDIEHMPECWYTVVFGKTGLIPTSGQPFRDAVIEPCAGEE